MIGMCQTSGIHEHRRWIPQEGPSLGESHGGGEWVGRGGQRGWEEGAGGGETPTIFPLKGQYHKAENI